MSTVALFAAEGAEARVLRRKLRLHEALDGPWAIHQGQLGGHPVVLIEAGVGKAAAAAVVAYAWMRFKPVQAFWLGTAGALNPSLKTLDLVLAQDAVQYDVDITAFGRAPGELATGERFIPADPGLTSKILRTAQALKLPIYLGRIASADRFLAHRGEAEEVRRIFAADAVEMEGAAALWTAKRIGMPMALLRAITDQAGHDAPLAFEAFLESASERLATLVELVIQS